MNRLPSFSESVIIPLEVYKSKFEHKDTAPKQKINVSKDILSTDLPADLKLKLFNQKKLDHEKKIPVSKDKIIKEKSFFDKRKESAFELYSTNDKQKIKDIFEFYIDRNPFIIDWNHDTNEVITYEKTIENSNIFKILEYLLNPQGSKPIGAFQVYHILIDLGVPRAWFGKLRSPSPSSSFETVKPSPQLTPSFSTPSTWKSFSQSPKSKTLFDFSPIADRVKRRTGRVKKVPYSPSWQNL